MTAEATKPTRSATAPDKPAGDAVDPSAASLAMRTAQRAVSDAISNQVRDTQLAHREAAQAVVAAVRSMAK